MSRKYKFHNSEGLYFVPFAVANWIDVFTRWISKDVLMDGLQYCTDHKGLRVHAYVLKTNHVHLIISKTSTAIIYIANTVRKEHHLKFLQKVPKIISDNR